ncbi:hypothetical protein EYZ11_003376 [Aspergillus tanneri]|uniref:DUF3752 domain-containing protein n=1 Tax=Aspergillus tanneri TaxID=1220188 RepID=A0A4S3JTL3_9EURO|nr:hypothetical protein EYZ11_003376 [Aspergillus tanneri]
MEPSGKRKFESATDSANTPDKRHRVIGPSLPPPSFTSEAPAQQSDSDEDSSDDDFGPSLPPPEGTVLESTAQVSVHNATPGSSAETEPAANNQSRRDEWMLLPPDDSSWASRVDPTKLRNRKFQSGRPGSSRPTGGVDASWTETPEQKMRRLQDEVMGVSTAPAAAGKQDDGTSRKNQAMQERIEKYNEARRKETAAEEASWKDKKKEEEEDDPSKRAFDKEKDMALGSRITASQRREIINKASDFGSRFSKGKYL